MPRNETNEPKFACVLVTCATLGNINTGWQRKSLERRPFSLVKLTLSPKYQ